MPREPEVLEKEAYSFLSEGNFEEAFKLFRNAAKAYRTKGNHKEATLCFASSASCWNKKYEDKSFFNAASSYESAARSALEYGDYAYASLLYKHAALNHERDVEFSSFSDCFYRSKECYRKFLAYSLVSPEKINTIAVQEEEKGIKGFIKKLFLLSLMTFSFIIWGHGERPGRIFSSGILMIVLSSFFYMSGSLIRDGVLFKPGFFEAIYFSVVTFTTVGYGDITPLGLTKVISSLEAFSGLFIMSLFVIGLSRKYLRI